MSHVGSVGSLSTHSQLIRRLQWTCRQRRRTLRACSRLATRLEPSRASPERSVLWCRAARPPGMSSASPTTRSPNACRRRRCERLPDLLPVQFLNSIFRARMGNPCALKLFYDINFCIKAIVSIKRFDFSIIFSRIKGK